MQDETDRPREHAASGELQASNFQLIILSFQPASGDCIKGAL